MRKQSSDCFFHVWAENAYVVVNGNFGSGIMQNPLPYYMAYPLPLQYDNQKIERRDIEYMKSMYPMLAKELLMYVEAEVDRLDYEGSVIYDEYPDQLQIYLLSGRIYDKVKDTRTEDEKLVRDMIQLLVFQEILQRRQQQRRDKRYFYLG